MDETQIQAGIEATYQQLLANAQHQAISAQVRLDHALRRISELEAAQTQPATEPNTANPDGD